MAGKLRLGTAVVVGLLVIGSCSDDDGGAGGSVAQTAAVAGPTSEFEPTVGEPSLEPSLEPSPEVDVPSTQPPSPPPLDVTPAAYTGETDGAPDQLPLPPVPEPGPPAASLTVDGSWTGNFRLDGTDPRVSVSCSAQPSRFDLVEVYALNYLVSTERGTGEYGLPDGGWHLYVQRTAGNDEGEVATSVRVAGVTADGDAVELADSSGIGEVGLAAAASADNSALSFSGVPAAIPRDHRLHELVEWVTFTGTIQCPGPLPELTLLRTDE